ncbi:MAG: cob(I)yrinic acid a,c-diamide adenosyltransferase [Acidobacteriota bacterium]
MKIYTKTGDKGETGLFGGPRVSKAGLRVEAYGTVDELNAFLGWAGSQLDPALGLVEVVRAVQSDLLSLGADLATPPDASEKVRMRTTRIGPDRAAWLESRIDEWDGGLEPLKTFILPGGDPGAAAMQVCRAVCRRAERAVVRLSREEGANPDAVVYLNRLSDALFVLARWINARKGMKEPPWKGAPQ